MKDNLEAQQEFVKELLSCVREEIDPDAICAGGAPRDWHLKRKPNDIDIYLRSLCNNNSKKQSQLCRTLERNGYDFEKVKLKDTTHYQNAMRIDGVLEYKIAGIDVNVQFIYIGTRCKDLVNEVMHNIDIGICKCYFIDEVSLTPAAEKDFKTKTLTLYYKHQEGTQLYHCIKNHLPKIQNYFPDHRIVME